MAYLKQITRKDSTGKRAPTGRWTAQVYFGKDALTGKTRWRSQTFATKKEAKDWAAKIETDRNRGSYRPTLGKTTLGGYITTTWLPLFKKRCRSWYNTEKTLGKWILRPQPNTPALGRIPLHKLKASDFNQLYLAMTEQRGPKRGDQAMRTRGVQHLHGLVKRVLKSAVKEGELTINPADGATLPDPDARADQNENDEERAQSLTQEQAGRFLTVARKHRWSALWHLLLDAGLRPGEAFALKWAQVDLDAKIVDVRATLTRGGIEKASQRWKLTPPKTKRSKRKVPISAATVAELKKWKKQQAADRLLVGGEWQDHGFVFTTAMGAPLGQTVHDQFAAILREADGGRGDLGTWGPELKTDEKKIGRPRKRAFAPTFPLYIMRHTSATLALLDGIDLLQVSRRLGHTDLSFTARMYGHLKAEHTTQAAESFNRLASGLG